MKNQEKDLWIEDAKNAIKSYLEISGNEYVGEGDYGPKRRDIIMAFERLVEWRKDV